jgi:glycerol-3-phosphate dehydrogenase
MQDVIRAPLGGSTFDVAVIGGGINGVAIARECGLGGLRTLLVERQDFACGTTSRSTRIIHGGLRYLEHGELALVRESLRERKRLLSESPNLVRPIHFLLALDESSRRNALAVRAGLWMYRRLGGKLRTKSDGKDATRRLEQALDHGRRWSVFDFEDGQCEFPERLVAQWLLEAVAAGVTVRNHTEALAIELREGRVSALRLRRLTDGAEERVEVKRVVNASGPWVDQVLQTCGISMQRKLIGGVRGSHIVVPSFAGMPEAAVYTEAVDGRPIFVIPWNGQVLVGTTEVPDQGDPAHAAPDAREIQYLRDSFLKLFPGTHGAVSQVRYAFAGIRPLPFTRNDKLGAITRNHILHDHCDDGAGGMISVIGGKLTTAGELARQCAAKLGLPATLKPILVIAGLSTRENACIDRFKRLGLAADIAQTVSAWHPMRCDRLISAIEKEPQLVATLCPHSRHIVAEAVDAFQNQYAVTLADALLRRVPVALGLCWDASCSRTAAERIGSAMGWNDHRIGYELENLEQERTAFLLRI